MNNLEKRSLKAKAHHLKPIIWVGAKGLTASLLNETEVALEAHELIKVKLNGLEKEDKRPIALALCTSLRAELIQLLGNIAIIYRKKLVAAVA